MTRLVDLSGMRFGRLVAEKYLGSSRWHCKCDCGSMASVDAYGLKYGKSLSCGCRKREISKEKATRHGMADSRIHRSWMSMRQRCLNPNDRAYRHYGGRGITICERWAIFENFAADMGPMPDGFTLDRINVNGNYEPSNCRWASPKQQGRNQRTNRLYTYCGETHCLSEWAEIKGLSIASLSTRLDRGWAFDKAISTPFRKMLPRSQWNRKVSA